MGENAIQLHVDLADLNEALEKADKLRETLREIQTLRGEDINVTLEVPIEIALKDGALKLLFEKIENEMRKADRYPHITVRAVGIVE